MIIITIDGPAASGKSTIARMLAHYFGYYYVCSGLLYRGVCYILVTQYGYTPTSVNKLCQADLEACCQESLFVYTYNQEHQERVIYDTVDITPYLKDSQIDDIVPIISTHEYVRGFVKKMQHAIARNHNIVIDGRDVGSLVFPDATVKFFLTASLEVRAHRWMTDQNAHGHTYDINHAMKSVSERDEKDKNRTVAPLIIPDNAYVIDNSLLTLPETIEKMVTIIKHVL